MWYSLLDTKMENYKEQYTNNKRRQRIEIEMVTYCNTCWLHWTPTTSKHHYWTLLHHKMLFKSFNNKQQKGKKETEAQIPKKKRIGNNISGILFVIIKWNARKNNTKKNETKNWNWNVYVLLCMLVTRDTAHFERSLLNADAIWNAVQIIQ